MSAFSFLFSPRTGVAERGFSFDCGFREGEALLSFFFSFEEEEEEEVEDAATAGERERERVMGREMDGEGDFDGFFACVVEEGEAVEPAAVLLAEDIGGEIDFCKKEEKRRKEKNLNQTNKQNKHNKNQNANPDPIQTQQI